MLHVVLCDAAAAGFLPRLVLFWAAVVELVAEVVAVDAAGCCVDVSGPGCDGVGELMDMWASSVGFGLWLISVSANKHPSLVSLYL